jgi:lactoylglutathione lyase
VSRFAYVIVYASDMNRSLTFFRDVLGLGVRFHSASWTEFQTEGVRLALHPAGAPATPRPSEGKNPAGGCSLAFQVDDLDYFHEKMQKQGVPCVQPPRMEAFGTRLAVYEGPDHVSITVSERTSGLHVG